MSRAHRRQGNLGSPVAFSGWLPEGPSTEGRPEAEAYVLQGGRSGRSTVDVSEGNELYGGKAPSAGDPGRGGAGPDTEPDHPDGWPLAGEGGGREVAPDPVHGVASPCRRGGAEAFVSAAAADSGAGSGRGDGGQLRAGSGGEPPEAVQAHPHRQLPDVHPEGRWREAAPWPADARGQDRPGRGGRGAERRLRGRLPRHLLWLPARTQLPSGPAPGPRCHHGGASELDWHTGSPTDAS